jgi:hypothetical protein
LELEDKSFTESVTFSVIVCISVTVFLDSSASFPISSATTAKPCPASPALAASMAAFNDKR